MANKYVDQNGLSRFWSKIKTLLSGKVDTTRKVNGKTLNADINITSDDITYGEGGEPLSDVLETLLLLLEGIDSSTVAYRTEQISVEEALNYLYSQVSNSSGGSSRTWSNWYEVPMYYENSKWSSVDVFPQLYSSNPLEVEIYFQIISPDHSSYLWVSQVIKIPTLVYEDYVSGLYINLGEIFAISNNDVLMNPSGIMGNVKAYIENGHIKAVDDSGGWCGDYCSLKCFYRAKASE